MKHLLHILLVAALLTLLAGGCRRSPGEAERRLIAIDSLIAAHPDSALTLLAEVDTATLAEPDRAYHALLTVQAMYKAYIPATDSTLICRAQRYYANHGPADRQIRTMSYRASVAEDLGDTEDAMRWYKRTELAAREHHDDFNTGYALMSMGVLYQSNFEHALAIDRYKSAIKASPAGNPGFAAFCNLQIAQTGLDTGMSSDSIDLFAKAAFRDAQMIGDSMTMANSEAVIAEKFFYDGNLDQAKSLLVSAISTYGTGVSCTDWQIASQIYSSLGMPDSARHYHEHSPKPINASDSSHWLHSRAMLSSHEGRADYALQYETQSDEITSISLLSASGSTLAIAESEAANSYAQSGKKFAAMLLAVLSAIALAGFAAAVLWYLLMSRKWRKSNEQLKHLLAEMKSDLARLHCQYGNAEAKSLNDGEILQGRELLRLHLERIKKQIKLYGTPGQPKSSTDLNNVAITDGEQEFWLSEFCHQLLYPKAAQLLDDIATRCELSDREKVVLTLVALNFNDGEIQALFGASSDAYARNILSRVGKKAGLGYSIRKALREIAKESGC